jgi:hypothetical protein
VENGSQSAPASSVISDFQFPFSSFQVGRGSNSVVESQPSKLLVAGSIPVSRSIWKMEVGKWDAVSSFQIPFSSSPKGADVAQLVEHVLGKDGVSGSIPLIGSIEFPVWGLYWIQPEARLRRGQAMMTSLELGNLIKDRLGAAGLAQYLDETKEQYLEFPDGFFAEVVLKDGSRLSEAQRIVKSIEEELRKQGVELDAIVRAVWEVVAVTSAGMAPAGSGGFHRFIATLRSGQRECTVSVDVTGSALAEILDAFRQGGLREYGVDQNAALVGIVSEFVRLELSYGGESYWDPILYPQRELNEAALSYLVLHSPLKVG